MEYQFQPNYHYAGFVGDTATFGSNGPPFLRYNDSLGKSKFSDLTSVTTNQRLEDQTKIPYVIPQIQRKCRLQSASQFYGPDRTSKSYFPAITENYCKVLNLTKPLFRDRSMNSLTKNDIPLLLPKYPADITPVEIQRYVVRDSADAIFKESFSPFIQDFMEPSNILEQERWGNLLAEGEIFLWSAPLDYGSMVLTNSTTRDKILEIPLIGRPLSLELATPCGSIVLARFRSKVVIYKASLGSVKTTNGTCKQVSVSIIAELHLQNLCDFSCLQTNRKTRSLLIALSNWDGDIFIYDIKRAYTKNHNLHTWETNLRLIIDELKPEERSHFSSNSKYVCGDVTLNTPPCLCTFCDAYCDRLFVTFGCTLRCFNISYENINNDTKKLRRRPFNYTMDPKRNSSFIDIGIFQSINILGRGITPYTIIGLDADYITIWDVRDVLTPTVRMQHSLCSVSPFSYAIKTINISKKDHYIYQQILKEKEKDSKANVITVDEDDEEANKAALFDNTTNELQETDLKQDYLQQILVNEIAISNGFECVVLTICSKPDTLFGVSLAQPYLVDMALPNPKFGMYNDPIMGVSVGLVPLKEIESIDNSNIDKNNKVQKTFLVSLLYPSMGSTRKEIPVVLDQYNKSNLDKIEAKVKEIVNSKNHIAELAKEISFDMKFIKSYNKASKTNNNNQDTIAVEKISQEMDKIQAARISAFCEEWEEFREEVYKSNASNKSYNVDFDNQKQRREMYINTHPEPIMVSIFDLYFNVKPSGNKRSSFLNCWPLSMDTSIPGSDKMSISVLKFLLENGNRFSKELFSSQQTQPGALAKLESHILQIRYNKIAPTIMKRLFGIGLNPIEKTLYSSVFHDYRLYFQMMAINALTRKIKEMKADIQNKNSGAKRIAKENSNDNENEVRQNLRRVDDASNTGNSAEADFAVKPVENTYTD